MITTPKISIIIPVYNGEQYIEECLRSLISQGLKDIEIIIIDDGSTDTTADLCKAYTAIDSRVKYHWSKNGGVSKARNTGLEMAIGDYIYFVDADDFVLSSGLEVLLNSAKSNDSDIVIADYVILSNDIEKVIHHNPKNSEHDILISVLNGNYHSAFWNKLIRHQLFSTIRFPETISYLEDFCTLLEILITCKPTISFCNRPVYAYRQHPDAVTSSGGEKFFHTFTALQHASQLLIQKNADEKAINALAKRIPQNIWSVLTTVNNNILNKAIIHAKEHLLLMKHLRPYQFTELKTRILLMTLQLPLPIAFIGISSIRSVINFLSPARRRKQHNDSAQLNKSI